MMSRVRTACALVFVVLTATMSAQSAMVPDSNYTFHRTMVTMRDGVKLNTVWFVPKKQTGPLPILFVRTPYGVPGPNFWPSKNPRKLHPVRMQNRPPRLRYQRFAS